MAARRIRKRRAADAARQLLYHRHLLEWISRKTEENEATLEGYLIANGEDRVVLLGGYVVGACRRGTGESRGDLGAYRRHRVRAAETLGDL